MGNLIYLRSTTSLVSADAYAVGGISPELVASFVTQEDGSTEGEYFRTAGATDDFSMFTFTRSGSAWYFNSSGVLTEATSGNARRNAYYHNGTSWVKGGMLLESAAATNIEDHSDLSAGWTQNGSVLAPNAETNNGLSFSRVDVTAGSGRHEVYSTGSGGTAGNHCHSAFVKSDGASHCCISVFSKATAVLNFSTGTIVATTGAEYVDSGVENIGGGVYRIWVVAQNAQQCVIGGADSDTPSYNGGQPTYTALDGEDFLVAGVQCEAGSVPTSYIPTSGSTVTRAAETLTIAGADTPANTSAMSISMKGLWTYPNISANPMAEPFRWRSSFSNRIESALFASFPSQTGGFYWIQIGPPDLLSQLVTANRSIFSPGINQPFRIASWHLPEEFNGAINGNAETKKTTPTVIPDLSATPLQVGQTFNGFVSDFRMWGANIGDSGIEEVTA